MAYKQAIQGTSVPTAGELLIGNGSGYSPATLTPGTGISIANAAGSITISNSGVNSVASGTGISVSTTSGVATVTNSGVTSLIAGTGISLSGSTGAVTISATGSGTPPGSSSTTAAASGNVVLTTSYQTLASLSLVAGTYLLLGNVSLENTTSSAKVCTLQLSTSANTINNLSQEITAVSNNNGVAQIWGMVTFTATTTVNLQALAASSSSLTALGGSTNFYGFANGFTNLIAIRVA